MEEVLKHVYVLCEVLKNDKSLIFEQIPEKYKRFHENVLMLRIYEMFDKELCTPKICSICVNFIKWFYIDCKKMKEVFIPNFVFMIHCILRHNSLAAELYNLGDVDDFVLISCFKICYETNENMAKFCFEKYVNLGHTKKVFF